MEYLERKRKKVNKNVAFRFCGFSTLTRRIIGQSALLKLLTDLPNLRDDCFDFWCIVQPMKDER